VEIERNFLKRKSFELRRISIDLLEEAVAHHDKRTAKLALVAYVLSKLSSKVSVRGSKDYGKFEKEVTKLMEIRDLDKLLKYLEKTDEKYGHYKTNLVDKGRAKFASKAYNFGISLSSASTLFDVEKGKILKYSGNETEIPKEGRKLLERWKTVKKLMGEVDE
jgi:hypothetical protein